MAVKEKREWNGFKLSKRLRAIVYMVPEGGRICDVGCDHAHVPIWLIKNGIIESALAMDVIPGPLEKADRNLRLYGERGRVQLRQSDGLCEYRAGECRTLVIAGMGGRIMEKILLREPEKTKSFDSLVLQPQADYELVRSAVRELGFAITREIFVLEDGKYYPVFRAERGEGQEHPSWDFPSGRMATARMRQQTEDLFGPLLLKRKDDTLLQFLLWQREVGLRVLTSIGEPAEDEDESKSQRRAVITDKVRHMDLALGCIYGEQN